MFSRALVDEDDEDIGLIIGRPLSHIAKDADIVEHEYKCLRDSPEKPGTRLWLMRRTDTFTRRRIYEWSHMSTEPIEQGGDQSVHILETSADATSRRLEASIDAERRRLEGPADNSDSEIEGSSSMDMARQGLAD